MLVNGLRSTVCMSTRLVSLGIGAIPKNYTYPHTNVGTTAPDFFVAEIARSARRTAEGVEDLLVRKSSIVRVVQVVEWTMLAGGGRERWRPRGL